MRRRDFMAGAVVLMMTTTTDAWAGAGMHDGGIYMDDERFWAIVDRTAVHEADTDLQTEALRQELEALTAEDVVAFSNTLQRHLARAYRWDLWAVGYIVEGGLSDDGFEYFRRWLLSKGRVTFEHVLAHPDDLADLLADGTEGHLEYEAFATVSWDVWGQKTGSSPEDIPLSLDLMTDGKDPAGDRPESSDASLAEHFPKTWARFGG